MFQMLYSNLSIIYYLISHTSFAVSMIIIFHGSKYYSKQNKMKTKTKIETGVEESNTYWECP